MTIEPGKASVGIAGFPALLLDAASLVAAFNQDDRFVTLPGYEWAGNTGLGGDRNVYYASEQGAVLYRSSTALIDEAPQAGTIARTASEVPSAESSSTKIISQLMPWSAGVTAARSGSTLSFSLIVGTTNVSSGACTWPAIDATSVTLAIIA